MFGRIADDWVVVDVEAVERDLKTAGGIVIPNSLQNARYATVIQSGLGKAHPTEDTRDEVMFSPGDRVLIQEYPGVPRPRITHEGKVYHLIRHSDVLAVVSYGPAGNPKAKFDLKGDPA